MKILHVGKYYSPIEGGIESINREVVRSLSGNDQLIISFNKTNKTETEPIDDATIIRCGTFGTFSSQPISIAYIFQLRKVIKRFKPDIVHIHHPNPLAAFYLLLSTPKRHKFKLILHWHSDIVAQQGLYKLIKPIESRLLIHADVIIATSPNYIEQSEPLTRFKDKITIIPCSIEESSLNVNDNERKWVEDIRGKYDNKPIVLFIGRHVEYKGIECLLKAEQLVKNDCVFLIAGQGSLTQSLKDNYQSGRIHWIGRISDEEKKLYYNAADILAFPSITKNEAFGVVLAEGMYCGCVPVTYTIEGSGVNWVSVGDQTGLQVPNSDISEYAKSIDRLLDNPALLKNFKEKAKERVCSLFTNSVVSQQYQKLYHSLNS